VKTKCGIVNSIPQFFHVCTTDESVGEYGIPPIRVNSEIDLGGSNWIFDHGFIHGTDGEFGNQSGRIKLNIWPWIYPWERWWIR